MNKIKKEDTEEEAIEVQGISRREFLCKDSDSVHESY